MAEAGPTIPVPVDGGLSLAAFFTDLKGLCNDLPTFVKDSSTQNGFILLADVLKVANDALQWIKSLQSDPAFEAIGKFAGIVAITADLTDFCAKLSNYTKTGEMSKADEVSLAADGMDFFGNILALTENPAGIMAGFSLKVGGWILGTYAASLPPETENKPEGGTGDQKDPPPSNPTTATIVGNTATQSNDDTLTYSTGATGFMQSDTWTSSGGKTGSDQVNADGSVTSTTNYANGGKAIETIDANGNETIDYYNAAGLVVSDSWSYSDGSSGSEANFNNGLTNIPNPKSEYSVPTTYSATLQNPDGSYQVVTTDSSDQITTTKYGADGSQLSSTTKQGSGRNFDADPTHEVVSGDPATIQLIETYDDVTNTVAKDEWTDVTGSGTISGSDVFNNSGAESGKATFTDGSYDTYSIYGGLGDSIFNHVRQSAESNYLTLDDLASAGVDATLNKFDTSGTLIASQWQMADGAKGNYTFSSNGAGSGTMIHANGLQSTITLDGSGGITVNNLNGGGQVVSSDWWNSDGTHGITTFDNGSITSKYTYELDGDVIVESYTSSGVQEDTLPAGEVLNADDSFFVKVVNADGTYSINYSDFNGDSLIFNYTGATLTGTDQVSLTRNPPDGFSGTLDDGTPTTSPYNGASAVIVEADGTNRTLYFNNSGKEVGDDWTKADGSHGSDSFEDDGSSEGVKFNADGTVYDYVNDGQGNSEADTYDANGKQTQSQWIDADGSKGIDAYFADGSWQRNTYAADGSYDVYHEGAAGDYSYTHFNTAGLKVSDEWVNADATYGDDTFNADGSSSGEAFTASDALYDTYTDDGAGDKTVYFYDGNGTAQLNIFEDTWTHSDGSTGVDHRGWIEMETAGDSASGTSTNADGSTSTYTRSLSGYTSTKYYSPTGVQTGTSWSAADGTHGSTTTNKDGSTTTNNYSADGSYSSLVDDGKGDLVNTHYSVGGVVQSDTWSKSDGTTGTDTFGADGSHFGTTHSPDGTSSSFVVSPTGLRTSQAYDANGTLIQSQSSFINDAGNLDVETYDGKGNFLNSAVTVTTATGTTTTTYAGADGSGIKLSDTWSTASGRGSDIYDASGTAIETISSDGRTTTITLAGAADESVTGDTLGDTITGNAGNDTLIAGGGYSTLTAGSGNDLLVAAATGTTVMSSGNLTGTGAGATTFALAAGSGLAIINAGVHDTLDLNRADITGVSFANGVWTLTGESSNSTHTAFWPEAEISGPMGYFSLDGKSSMSFAAAMAALAGGEQLFATYTSNGPAYDETSKVSTTLLPLLNALNSTGLSLTGSNVVGTANDQDCLLTAYGSQDTLVGGAGNDTLYMSVQADAASSYDGVLVGGSGATTFNLDNGWQRTGTIEVVGSTSKDTLNLGINSWNSAQPIESVTGTELQSDGSVLVHLGGIANVDVLIGTTGTYLNRINGPSDLDLPNNSITLDDALRADGALQAVSSTTVTLPYDVVQMTLTGSANIAATGNTLDDIITANSGNDTLVAGIANDTLVAGSGNDSIVGGAGSDVMLAGTGSDTMVAGTGADTFKASTGQLTIVGAKSGDRIDFGETPIADITAVSTTTGGVTTVTLTSNLGGSVAVVGSALAEVDFGSNGALSMAQLLGTAPIVYSSTGGTLGTGVSNLTLSGNADLSATGNSLNDLITANNGDDLLTAGSGIDTLVGGSGNDTLVSGSSTRAVLIGGSGTNTFVVNNSGDVIEEPINGQNNVEIASVSVTLADNVTNLVGVGSDRITLRGNSLADVITGNSGYDVLIGGSGPTTLISGSGTAVMEGGSGPTLMITGRAGNELIAGSGLTTMVGGAIGNSSFIINNAADVIDVAAPGTNDLEYSYVSTTVATNLAYLEGMGTDDIVLTGNDSAHVDLVANSGNDTLVGGTGITHFSGGSGNDVFVVNNSADQVYVGSLSLGDIEESSVSIVLGDNVRTLVGLGNAAITLTGNSTNDDVITANSGDDTLVGGAGNDTLVAGAGNDVLVGGSANDVFVINSAQDIIQEAANTGSNTEETSVSTLQAANVQNLTGLGTSDLMLTGNSAGGTITANAGNDTLVAGGAQTTLVGGAGADMLVGAAGQGASATTRYVLGGFGGSATIQESGTNDSLVISDVVASMLTATTSTGTVDGVSGQTIVTLQVVGGRTITLEAPGFSAVTFADGQTVALADLIAEGALTTVSATSATLGAGMNRLVLSGTANLVGTGNDIADSLLANSGNDTLIAGSGIATMYGGAGNDMFVVNNAADVIVEGANSGQNVEQTSVSTVLAANVEQLVATGTSALVLTGAATAGVVASNSGADTLVAGSGVTTLIGGVAGNTFEVNSGTDVVLGAAGTRNVELATASVTAGANVQSLTDVGQASITLTGNTLDDVITGGTSFDVLVGGSGNDTLVGGSGGSDMIGGTGNDTFVLGTAGDTIEEAANSGSNTERTAFSTTLADNVQNLVATGSDALTLYGNDGNDVITGNAGNDTIFAGSGNDTLISGSGDDYMLGGSGNDTFVLTADASSNDYIEENYVGGNDVEYSAIQTELAQNVQTLIGTGTAALYLWGSGQDNDTVIANSGNDTLEANGGQTTLVAGAGSDVLFGNEIQSTGAATTYDYNLGDGATSVWYTQSNDVLQFGTGISATAINATSQQATINGVAGTIVTLQVSGGTQVVLYAPTFTQVKFADGTSTTLSALLSAGKTMTSAVSATLGTGYTRLVLTGSANITGTGNSLADTIIANSGNDTLIAGSGLATLVGGSGNDTFVVNNVGDVITEAPNAGNNTEQTSVSVTLAANVQNLTGTGTTALTLTGNNLNNLITANSGADRLVAGTGNDTLVSGAGIDTLVGGAGNDVFVVNNALDLITEAANSGSNTEQASVSVTLAANVQNLTAMGAAALTLTGNTLNNVITANNAADTLVSGSGVDTLVGGTGNDVFVVNNAADVIIDGANAGSNLEQASVSATLAANVQNLTGIGTGAITLTGNNLNNVITANSGADKLVAGSGNDTLVSGAGIDTLVGGAGNDVFVINNASDVITEGANSGNNTEQTSVSVTLAANVQNLTGTGTAAVTLTGNALNNVITANSGADKLVAGSGLDTLVSGTGVDTLVGGTANDVFVVNNASDVITKATNSGNNTEQSSVSVTLAANVQNLTGIGSAAIKLTGNTLNDVITANSGNDTLVAGSGLDTLVSGTGVDSLVGGTGNDVFVINNASDVITKSSNSGSNTEQTSVSVTLAANVQNLAGIGAAAIKLTGNTLANVITANSGNDTLVAGSGLATMIGGAGNDVFVVNNASDVITEGTNSGNNTEQTSVSVTLAANVQNLTGTGTSALTLTGNSLNNVITANSGADKLVAGSGLDTLVSGTGIDTLVGGTANDVFVVNNASDVITKSTNSGNNTEQSSVSVTLAANVQNLTGIGSAAIKLTGNTLNDVITANSGNDTLVAGSGLDTLVSGTGVDSLVGGTGNDVFVINNASDVITKSSNSGSNTEQTSVSVTLAANVQNLTGIGSAAIKLTGNTLNDVITANSGNDTLVAGSGTDTLLGGDGSYSASVGAESDTLTFGNGNDTLVSTEGSANAETFKLGNGNDQVTLGSGTDHLTLGNGVDTVTAKAGTDTLTLGTGQYTLANTGAIENAVLTSGAENQLWFAHVGNNLQINVLGSSEQITVANWFTTGTKLNQLTSSDGHTINAAGIDQLVQAMASFGIPPSGQTSFTGQEQTALAPVLAANWH